MVYKIMNQLYKFWLGGLFVAGINLFVLYSFTEFLGINYIRSAIFGFIIANTSLFILNKSWIFKEKFGNKIFNKYLKFFFISMISLSINILFLYVFTEFFRIYYVFSQILATFFSFWIDFFGNKFFIFKK